MLSRIFPKTAGLENKTCEMYACSLMQKRVSGKLAIYVASQLNCFFLCFRLRYVVFFTFCIHFAIYYTSLMLICLQLYKLHLQNFQTLFAGICIEDFTTQYRHCVTT